MILSQSFLIITEVHSKLGAAENRCNLLEKQLEYMRKMVQSAEKERHTVLHKQEMRESREAEMRRIGGEEDREEDYQKEKLDEMERERVKLRATQTLAEVSWCNSVI